MKVPSIDVARFLGDFLGRRALFGRAGTVSLGAALAALGAPQPAAAASDACPGLPPTSYNALLGLCSPGTGTSVYTPAIKNTLQTIQNNDTVTFSPCAVAGNLVVTGLRDSFVMIASCSGVTDLSGGGEILYSNGQRSRWTLDSCNGARLLGQQVGVVSGVITNGPFNGARLWKFSTRAVNNPSICASSGGLTSSTGTNTLIIAE